VRPRDAGHLEKPPGSHSTPATSDSNQYRATLADSGATLDGTFRWERDHLDAAVADRVVERFHTELAAA
jgi:hypothetical protein